MHTTSEKRSYNRIAGLGFIFLFPTLYFMSAAFLKYELGVSYLFDPLERFYENVDRLRAFNLASPIVFLGGILTAVALNMYAIVHLNVRKEEDTIISTITVKPRLWNLVVIALSFLLLAIMGGYLLVENYNHP